MPVWIIISMCVITLPLILLVVKSMYDTLHDKTPFLYTYQKIRKRFPKLSYIFVGAYLIVVIVFTIFKVNYVNFETQCYMANVKSNISGGTYKMPVEVQYRGGKYRIQHAYWPNGGYITFKNKEVSFDEYIEVSDIEDKKWYIQLTPQHTSLSVIDEVKYSYFGVADIMCIVGTIIAISFVITSKVGYDIRPQVKAQKRIDTIYCKHCGKKIEPDSTFCKWCGCRISSDHSVTSHRKVITNVRIKRQESNQTAVKTDSVLVENKEIYNSDQEPHQNNASPENLKKPLTPMFHLILTRLLIPIYILYYGVIQGLGRIIHSVNKYFDGDWASYLFPPGVGPLSFLIFIFFFVQFVILAVVDAQLIHFNKNWLKWIIVLICGNILSYAFQMIGLLLVGLDASAVFLQMVISCAIWIGIAIYYEKRSDILLKQPLP